MQKQFSTEAGSRNYMLFLKIRDPNRSDYFFLAIVHSFLLGFFRLRKVLQLQEIWGGEIDILRNIKKFRLNECWKCILLDLEARNYGAASSKVTDISRNKA